MKTPSLVRQKSETADTLMRQSCQERQCRYVWNRVYAYLSVRACYTSSSSNVIKRRVSWSRQPATLRFSRSSASLRSCSALARLTVSTNSSSRTCQVMVIAWSVKLREPSSSIHRFQG